MTPVVISRFLPVGPNNFAQLDARIGHELLQGRTVLRDRNDARASAMRRRPQASAAQALVAET